MNHLEDMFNLGGKTVIVTGGAGLLGRQYVAALARAGAHAVIADIDDEAGERLVREIEVSGGARAVYVRTDVADKASVNSMVAGALSEFGRIDGLVNNCALDPKFDRDSAGSHKNSFEEFPLDLWERSLQVNLTGMFLCAQAVARPMLAGGGSIVNVSSTYGMVGPDQRLYEEPGSAERSYKPVTYSVSKSAVIGLTRYLATYWAGKNIRVNTFTPGGVFNDQPDSFVSRYSSRTPLGRMASSQEYCGAMLFLLSDASSYMTGANLVVDGGWTAW